MKRRWLFVYKQSTADYSSVRGLASLASTTSFSGASYGRDSSEVCLNLLAAEDVLESHRIVGVDIRPQLTLRA
jgi:hypothetical protein